MSRKRLELTGKKFGKLTVLKRDDKDNGKWLCECDCGNIKTIQGSNLHSGNTKSCGHCKKNIDYHGKVFGSWTIVKRDTKTKNESWIAKCECGRIKSLSTQRIKKGDIPYCKVCEMIGKVFNRLTVQCHSGKSGYLLCRCECGNKIKVSPGELKSGKKKSCGCINESKRVLKPLVQVGILTLIKPDAVLRGHWICECDCGNMVSVPKTSIQQKGINSCGCLNPKNQNLIGKKIGHLTVIKKTYNKWLCSCDCGKEVEKSTGALNSENNPSCGCVAKKYQGIPKSLKLVLTNMKQRCYNPNQPIYEWYGGKGVTICSEWLDDPMQFYTWAMKNGYQKGLELDRINGDGNYEQSNCRFVTKTENLRNRSHTYNKAV